MPGSQWDILGAVGIRRVCLQASALSPVCLIPTRPFSHPGLITSLGDRELRKAVQGWNEVIDAKFVCDTVLIHQLLWGKSVLPLQILIYWAATTNRLEWLINHRKLFLADLKAVGGSEIQASADSVSALGPLPNSRGTIFPPQWPVMGETRRPSGASCTLWPHMYSPISSQPRDLASQYHWWVQYRGGRNWALT